MFWFIVFIVGCSVVGVLVGKHNNKHYKHVDVSGGADIDYSDGGDGGVTDISDDNYNAYHFLEE